MAQIVDQRDLIATFQPGDLSASERLVRVYQNELVRTAYLLTGTPEGAVLLARDAFLSYFRVLVRGERTDDPRLGVLQQLGHCFLADPDESIEGNGDRPERLREGTIALGVEQQRYRVEDDRSRVIALLDLLDLQTRLGLVLRDFNALEEEPVCQLLGEVPFALRQRLHPTRDRVRDAASVGPDHSVRVLLVNSATAAPRPDLWPEVLGPLEEFYAEEDERRQRLTYGAAVGVGVLLLFAGLWLFDLLPFVSGDGNSAAIASTAGPTATPTATPEPTPTATMVPSLSSYAIPQGDVPDRLFMIVGGGIDEDTFGFFDIDSGAFSSSGLPGVPLPSPDGRFLIGRDLNEAGPNGNSSRLSVFDSGTGEQLWESEELQTVYSVAVTMSHIYVAALAAESSNAVTNRTPELHAYDLETGERVQTWTDLMIPTQPVSGNSFLVHLIASPDGERLFIATEEFGSNPAILSARILSSYSLPEMTLESVNIQTDTTASRQFPTGFTFADARPTPDGHFIYRINYEDETIQFRSSDESQDSDLALPFVAQRPLNENLLWITSNDGRFLYVIAHQRAEVVIVDLLARQVVRSFSLDFAEPVLSQRDKLRGQRSIGPGFGFGLTLSHDGGQLYLLTFFDGSTDTDPESSLWTIDLTTWTVTAVQALPGIALIVSEDNGMLVLLSERGSSGPSQSDRRVTVVDQSTGEVVSEYTSADVEPESSGISTIALHELYRLFYGRAAAIEHVAPGDVEIESTLPRISVVASYALIPAGKPFDVAVRALNPVDGQLIAEASPAVRFDPDSTVIVRLVHAEGAGDAEILVTSRTDPGRFAASTALLETGYWNAEVTLTGVDGRSLSFTIAEVFQIVPSWEASDGKRYFLRVRTDPREPTVDVAVDVTARFVEIESGAPLPEGVEILAAFPSQIRVAFASENRGGASVLLERDEGGIYVGRETFGAAGEWRTSVSFRLESGESFDIEAGAIAVAE